MGLLDGKRILVTGVLTDASIAFTVARLAQEQGAEVVLTSFGRTMNLTKRSAGRLPTPAPVIELDVTNEDDLASLASRVAEHVSGLDGVLHSIGQAGVHGCRDGVLFVQTVEGQRHHALFEVLQDVVHRKLCSVN